MALPFQGGRRRPIQWIGEQGNRLHQPDVVGRPGDHHDKDLDDVDDHDHYGDHDNDVVDDPHKDGNCTNQLLVIDNVDVMVMKKHKTSLPLPGIQ